RMQERRRELDAVNAAHRARRLVIGHWCVFRFDDDNFVLSPVNQNDEAHRLYYPNLVAALSALLPKLIEDEVHEAADLTAILAAVRTAEGRIVAAVQEQHYARPAD